METIKVIVNERDYDEMFYVSALDERCAEVERDSVEVSKEKYDRYCVLVEELEELEEYFLSFESESQREWRLEYEAAQEEHQRAYEEAQRKVQEQLANDSVYQKAQEKVKGLF